MAVRFHRLDRLSTLPDSFISEFIHLHFLRIPRRSIERVRFQSRENVNSLCARDTHQYTPEHGMYVLWASSEMSDSERIIFCQPPCTYYVGI